MQRWTILMATLAPLPGRGIDEMISVDLPPDQYLPGTVRACDLERGLMLPTDVTAEVIIAQAKQDPEVLAVYGLDEHNSVLFRVETAPEDLPIVFDHLGDKAFFR